VRARTPSSAWPSPRESCPPKRGNGGEPVGTPTHRSAAPTRPPVRVSGSLMWPIRGVVKCRSRATSCQEWATGRMWVAAQGAADSTPWFRSSVVTIVWRTYPARNRDLARARASARGGACGTDAGGYADGAREESHAAARGGDGTGARARARCRRGSRSYQRPHRYYRVTLGGRVTPSAPPPAALTACVIAGCVGHASVHCDSGPRAWGSGERARYVCFTADGGGVSVGGPRIN